MYRKTLYLFTIKKLYYILYILFLIYAHIYILDLLHNKEFTQSNHEEKKQLVSSECKSNSYSYFINIEQYIAYNRLCIIKIYRTRSMRH